LYFERLTKVLRRPKDAGFSDHEVLVGTHVRLRVRQRDRPRRRHLHAHPANGLANAHNARRANTSMVNIGGDHATYHKKYDALLTSDV
jgi:hypothetical protein